MRRLIIFLTRKRLGLRKYEGFQFNNQKSKAIYFFTGTELMKYNGRFFSRSDCSLNWITNDHCIIWRVDDDIKTKWKAEQQRGRIDW